MMLRIMMLCISIDHWFTLVNNKILIIYCEYNKILDIKYKTSEKEWKNWKTIKKLGIIQNQKKN